MNMNVITFNDPYSDRNKRYMHDRTKIFANERAYLSSDYVKAKVQGLTDSFYDYTNVNIRLADVSTLNVTSLFSKRTDDFKRVLIPNYDYIPIGAKIETMNSVWVAINPENISAPLTETIIARCNASFNYYDEYGNIKTEPIIIEHSSMFSNNTQTPLNNMLMAGYFTVLCQLNDVTSQLSENSRIILGKKAYRITGYQDFIQEFSGDYDSCHLCSFTLRVEEPIEDDDIPNRIANGLLRSFKCNILGNSKMNIGTSQTLNTQFIVDGQISNLDVDWEYSTESDIISIQDNVVTAIDTGNAHIVARMVQNPSVYDEIEISVEELVLEPYTAFIGTLPNTLTQYEKVTLTAGYYENGELTQEIVSFTVDGDCYYTIDGNEITIECIEPSDKPVVIKAEYNGYSTQHSMLLLGY